MKTKFFLLLIAFFACFASCSSQLAKNKSLAIDSLNNNSSFNGHPIAIAKNSILTEFGSPIEKHKNAGCFIPYSTLQKKTKYKPSDCIKYDKYSYKDYEIILTKGHGLLSYIDFRKAGNYLIVSETKLDSHLSYSEISNKFSQDLAYNEGLNMLIDKDESYYNENKAKLNHCYLKLGGVVSAQLVFRDDMLVFAFFIPNTATFL